MPSSPVGQHLDLLDASIAELQNVLSSGSLTSVDLVSRYLRRISVYDANGLKLSAIPILNPTVFDEAAASDARRIQGLPPRPLEGIPYLVKDNIKVQGMVVGNGSPAFEKLIANEDAACVQILRNAGAVLLGRTNMPAMAYGGMQRGVWGRAESPYNSDYLAAAYASGSSNGSAVATSANLCAFSLGTETVSSGRSPASNNAVVAYTPSKGLLPLRGVFPLYPTCDVLVPHTKTVADLFCVLDVLAVADQTPVGDFYNEQSVVAIPSITSIRPKSFSTLGDKSSLKGKRIAVPSMYIGGDDSSIPQVSKVNTRPSILKLWKKAKQALEACGAEVIEIDFPLVTTYESNASTGQLVTVANLPDGWASKERCEVVSHAWDDFLATNGQKGLQSLTYVDPDTIFPLAPGSLLGTPEAANKPRWGEIVKYPRTKPASIFEIPGMKQAIQALEDARKKTFEEWMDENGLDAVVFPANGDIGAANADVNKDASDFAWTNGVKYSNGNRPIRHLGVPTISVPMGIMDDTNMPVNLTFAGKAYEDNDILSYGFAFEKASKSRVPPSGTPALDSDYLPTGSTSGATAARDKLELLVTTQRKEVRDSNAFVEVKGSVSSPAKSLSCYVNGEHCDVSWEGEKWTITSIYPISHRDSEWKSWESPAVKQTIVIVVAHSESGSSSGKLILL
ncbi:Amidase [Penicillium waksmanii]|uniref:Amidase n=1 Tax=Penicillium waksmanii TaxID=69791 RepID=UPI0025488DEE|nr:Amidase [Penicillium waksmanii]KAJ5983346.1 Amidase [Penicillium waksmanii]